LRVRSHRSSKFYKVFGELSASNKSHNQGGENPEQDHGHVRKLCRKLMKHLGRIKKPRLQASKSDRTWNDDDDECHLAGDET
jgi:hypothetical protein